MKPTYTELVSAIRDLLAAEERHSVAIARSTPESRAELAETGRVVVAARATARYLLERDARAYARTCPVAGMGVNLHLEAARAAGLIGAHELRAEGRVHA